MTSARQFPLLLKPPMAGQASYCVISRALLRMACFFQKRTARLLNCTPTRSKCLPVPLPSGATPSF